DLRPEGERGADEQAKVPRHAGGHLIRPLGQRREHHQRRVWVLLLELLYDLLELLLDLGGRAQVAVADDPQHDRYGRQAAGTGEAIGSRIGGQDGSRSALHWHGPRAPTLLSVILSLARADFGSAVSDAHSRAAVLNFGFRISDLFRISNFGFRVCGPAA